MMVETQQRQMPVEVVKPPKRLHRYTISLRFNRYSLTTMAKDTPYNSFSIIQGHHSIYVGSKFLSAYNFPPQPGSAPQV